MGLSPMEVPMPEPLSLLAVENLGEATRLDWLCFSSSASFADELCSEYGERVRVGLEATDE